MPWYDKYKQDLKGAAVDNTAVQIHNPLGTTISTSTSPYTESGTKKVLDFVGQEGRRKKSEEEARIKNRNNATTIVDNKKGSFTFPNGETKEYSKMSTRESAYVKGQALQTRGRFFPNEESYIDDLNPLNWIGNMVSNMAQAPYKAKESDSYIPYVSAVLEPLLMGRMMGSGTINPFSKKMWTNEISNAQFVNNLGFGIPNTVRKAPRAILNGVDNFSEIGSKLNRFEKIAKQKGLNDLETNQFLLDNVGITREQRKAYLPFVSDMAEKYVTPYGYTGDLINNFGNKYLPNAHKLNPYAFKASEDMGYRMLGKEGYQDAIESGVLRAKPIPNQPVSGGISLARNTNRNPNTGKMQGALDRPYFADGFIDERYAADYMAAVNKADNNLVPIPTHKGIAPAQAGSIPLENATMYKKDWLKGYKQVEVPKTETTPIRDLFIQPKQKFSDPSLSNIEEPYISKKVFNDSKEQQVFESSFQPEQQAKLLEYRTKYYDSQGNVIPKPKKFQQGGKFTENEKKFLEEVARLKLI